VLQRPLQEPVVSCALGKLYNKDALLEYLLDRSAHGEGEEVCGHVKSLKVILEALAYYYHINVFPGRQDFKVNAKPSSSA
jgi:membrane peptidoglycan carboxypeptidase